jgi:hypothetical protein
MRCTYCKREMIKPPKDGVLSGLMRTRDHVIPLSRGGVDLKRNIVPACYRCNSLKGDMMPDAWQQFMADNPCWWASQINKPIVSAISKPRVAKLSETEKRERATELLRKFREDPEYIQVPVSYTDDYAQLCYEVAMQNPHNWVGNPFAKRAPMADFRNMTADENARRIRAYWKRISDTQC